MAGESDKPNLDREPEKPKPLARTFSCPGCGGNVVIRFPGAVLSCACEFCHVVIDVTDSNYRIIEGFFYKMKGYEPFVPLGTRAELKGKTWELIGYMVRSDTVSNYMWEEYLLFNPYYGFRWLTRNGNHWSLVTMIKDKPSENKMFSGAYITSVSLYERQFKLYYRGRAKVEFVTGEFYWKVKADTRVEMSDFVSAPYMLSCEQDSSEKVWSLSEYIEADEVEKAFKPERLLSRPKDYAPNQPIPDIRVSSQISRMLLGAFLLLLALQIWQVSINPEHVVYSDAQIYQPNDKNAPTYTTKTFDLSRPVSGVRLTFRSDVDNSWLYLSGEMVNDETGETYPFGETVEYYSGYDGGESWSEGSRTVSKFIAAVPRGKYYLNIDSESGDFRTQAPQQYSLAVTEGAQVNGNFWWVLAGLLVAPILSWIVAYSADSMRWANSDYSPYRSSES
ncbi:MAG: DUF4178 domain-containing protein [Candidatus Obscuribacterales bacterium]|nr:DUF4178 domain-containing protein [Candidatus Obscuribacterales bacterium]